MDPRQSFINFVDFVRFLFEAVGEVPSNVSSVKSKVEGVTDPWSSESKLPSRMWILERALKSPGEALTNPDGADMDGDEAEGRRFSFLLGGRRITPIVSSFVRDVEGLDWLLLVPAEEYWEKLMDLTIAPPSTLMTTNTSIVPVTQSSSSPGKTYANETSTVLPIWELRPLRTLTKFFLSALK